MGLCKCEKRKVTNLFCFECKVNVCEACMVSDQHSSCVIQTYLAWLSDSDFLPQCKCCDKPLTFSPCIRFPCLCVFHIDCVNERFSKLPKSTAPAGFKCPTCEEKIFPTLNAGGPLALQVKEKLKDFPWARTGLGLPLLKNVPKLNENSVSSSSSILGENTHHSPQTSVQISQEHTSTSHQTSTVKQRKQVRINDSHNTHEIAIPEAQDALVDPFGNPADPNRQNDDRAFRPPAGAHRTPDVDFKAFKYRRKSITQRLKRLLQNHYASRKYHEPIMGQTTPILVCLVIVVSLSFIWMTTSVVRHHRNDYDPVLDPYRNPNIKIGDGPGIFPDQAPNS